MASITIRNLDEALKPQIARARRPPEPFDGGRSARHPAHGACSVLPLQRKLGRCDLKVKRTVGGVEMSLPVRGPMREPQISNDRSRHECFVRSLTAEALCQGVRVAVVATDHCPLHYDDYRGRALLLSRLAAEGQAAAFVGIVAAACRQIFLFCYFPEGEAPRRGFLHLLYSCAPSYRRQS
jgi:hypothetical protein